jgi:outer membrane receptor protein involved in Fe transport
VNVNTLPNRGLERIEILRDGASSIYGSDAVAGVVNYQMSTRFRGTEIELQFGETSYRDGQEIRATVTHGLGFAQGKGRMIMTADFYNRKAMFQSSRAFSASGDHVGLAPAPWNVYTNTTFNGLTATSQYGQFALGTVTGTTAYGRPIFAAARPASIPATYAAANGNFFIVPAGGTSATIGTAAPARSARRVADTEGARNAAITGRFAASPSTSFWNIRSSSGELGSSSTTNASTCGNTALVRPILARPIVSTRSS